MSRVSSDEQALGYSLGVQQEALEKHCERNNIEIVYKFKEDHSAKDFERPEFRIFLKYLEANKNKVDLLLFTTWDRFSRNITDSLIMIRRLALIGITPQAIEQPIDISVPENKAMLALYLVLPEVDNDRRSIKIRGGIRAALKSGRHVFNAPRGYKNSRDEKNKPILKPSDDAHFITTIFHKIAYGSTQSEVRLLVKKKGYKISKSTLSDLLRNPIYTGKIVVPKEGNEQEQIILGIHEPLVSQEIFDRVQVMLKKKMAANNKPNFTKKREELLLRGNLECDKCGMALTGSASKNRTGNKYFYYHCNHCHKVRFPALALNKMIEGILTDFNIKKGPKEIFSEIMKEKLKVKKEGKKQDPLVAEKKLQEISKRMINIQDMLADGTLSAEDFRNMKQRYEEEKIKFMPVAQTESIISIEQKEKLLKCFNAINTIGELYKNANLENKKRILCSTFPEKIVFDGKKCRTQKINEVFRLALNADAGFRRKKTGQFSKNLVLSGEVENIGVEPTTSCMPCKRSSQLS